MDYLTYLKIMSYLDIIEEELNKVAKKVGSCSFEEFMEEERRKEEAKKKE